MGVLWHDGEMDAFGHLLPLHSPAAFGLHDVGHGQNANIDCPKGNNACFRVAYDLHSGQLFNFFYGIVSNGWIEEKTRPRK